MDINQTRGRDRVFQTGRTPSHDKERQDECAERNRAEHSRRTGEMGKPRPLNSTPFICPTMRHVREERLLLACFN